jgi:nitroreductase/ferredoxin
MPGYQAPCKEGTVCEENRSMKRLPTTEIDRDLCTGCGLCVAVCPSQTLSLVDGTAAVTGTHSIGCDHCAAICPECAITVHGLDNDALALATIECGDDVVPYGGFDTAALVKLMRSRRSCRLFSDRPVERDKLEDLVKIGTTAPSGTNSQQWTFTIVSNRSAMLTMGALMAEFFQRINRMAEKSLVRFLSKLFMHDAMGTYYRNHYESVKEALAQWKEEGRDRLFHGATSALLVGMKPGASCPAEDALMVSQNILLAAHAMGLGSCMIGFAVEALRHDRRIAGRLGIPGDERIYAVIALGYPKGDFARPAGRKKVIPRYYEG